MNLLLCLKDKKDDGVIEMIKERIKGKNEADVEELIKLLNQHMSHPELRAVRRGSGRRGPRTRSVCVSELKKMSIKSNEENNNEDDDLMTGIAKNSSEIPSSSATLTLVDV